MTDPAHVTPAKCQDETPPLVIMSIKIGRAIIIILGLRFIRLRMDNSNPDPKIGLYKNFFAISHEHCFFLQSFNLVQKNFLKIFVLRRSKFLNKK